MSKDNTPVYEFVNIEEARKRSYDAPDNKRFLEIEGFILQGKGNLHFYGYNKHDILHEKPLPLYITRRRGMYKTWDKLEAARIRGDIVRIRGERVIGGLDVHDVIFPSENGLSLYNEGIESTLAFCEEEGGLYLVREDETN